MGARGDVTDLQTLDGALAAEFDRLRADIDAADLESPDLFDYAIDPVSSHDAARRISEDRRRLVAHWDRLLTRIRDLPGLEVFLLPPPIERLRAHAAEGPVVFVNASHIRSDALILTSDASNPVRIVPLPALLKMRSTAGPSLSNEAA